MRTTTRRATAAALLLLTAFGVPAAAQGEVIAVHEAKLTASDGQTYDKFGRSIARDGDRLVIGASSSPGIPNAYVFDRIGGQWSEGFRLRPDPPAEDFYRLTLAVSGDRVVLGLVGDSLDVHRGGSVRVFDRTGATWSETARIVPPDLHATMLFGTAVALDGDTLVVGASSRSTTTAQGGGVYVYEWNGAAWQLSALLEGDDAPTAGRGLGAAVAFDGTTLVAGAPSEANGVGAAYVYRRRGTGWTQEAKLVPPDIESVSFGTDVALHADSVVAGAPLYGATGTAYVYTRVATTWSQEARLSFPSIGSRRGATVAIAGDVAVSGSSSGSGSVLAFLRRGTSWSGATEHLAPDLVQGDSFGRALQMDGLELFVGAPWAPGVVIAAGAVHLFHLQPSLGEPGVSLCFGDGSGGACPCGNTGSAGEGCRHSGSRGMRIRAGATTSVAADDLTVVVEQCPPSNAGILYAGTTSLAPGMAFHDGLQCAGGDVRRFRGRFQTVGTVADTGFVAQDPSGFYFQPGVTYFFQKLVARRRSAVALRHEREPVARARRDDDAVAKASIVGDRADAARARDYDLRLRTPRDRGEIAGRRAWRCGTIADELYASVSLIAPESAAAGILYAGTTSPPPGTPFHDGLQCDDGDDDAAPRARQRRRLGPRLGPAREGAREARRVAPARAPGRAPAHARRPAVRARRLRRGATGASPSQAPRAPLRTLSREATVGGRSTRGQTLR